jgi:hypothetical protein
MPAWTRLQAGLERSDFATAVRSTTDSFYISQLVNPVDLVRIWVLDCLLAKQLQLVAVGILGARNLTEEVDSVIEQVVKEQTSRFENVAL